MSVHYKFKSSVAYDTVTFDGLHISVGDLKKAILQQKKIGKSADFDLQITNAQTKEIFTADEELVPKNTSVIVARVPVSNPVKKSWERSDTNSLMQGNDSPSHVAFDKLAKTADLVNANATEEEKIKAMMTQSAHEYDPSKYVKSRSMTGPLPANYICFRCGKTGHWIKSCPTNNIEIKRSTGIPRSFMVTVEGPETKGALLTSSGDFAVPLIDQQAYKVVKKEKPPFLKEAEVIPEAEPQPPEDLLCMVCRDLLQDAVLIPCCGNSFCDECVRQALLDSENHECPVCHEIDISPDTLIPNRFQRNAVRNFKNETGYIRMKKAPPLEPSSNPVAVMAAIEPSTTSALPPVKEQPTDPPMVVVKEVPIAPAALVEMELPTVSTASEAKDLSPAPLVSEENELSTTPVTMEMNSPKPEPTPEPVSTSVMPSIAPEVTVSEHTFEESSRDSPKVHMSISDTLLADDVKSELGSADEVPQAIIDSLTDGLTIKSDVEVAATEDKVREQSVRAATPLADEPPVEYKSRYSEEPKRQHHYRSHHGYDSQGGRSHYGLEEPSESNEPSTISTITTRSGGGAAWPPGRKPYWTKYNSNQPYESSHRDSRDSRDYYRSSSSEYQQHRGYNSQRGYSRGTGYRYSNRGSSRGSSRSYSHYNSPPPGGSRYASPPPAGPSHRSSHSLLSAPIHQPEFDNSHTTEQGAFQLEPPPPGTDHTSSTSEASTHREATLSNRIPPLTSHREQAPSSHRDLTSSHRDPPSSHRDASVSHRDLPLSHREPPPTHREPPPTHREPPPTHREPPPTHREPPPTHREPLPTHREPPPTHRDPPPTHRESTQSHREPASAHRDPPPSHQEAPPSHREPTPSHRELTSSHRDTQSHREPPLTHREPPSSHREAQMLRESTSHHEPPPPGVGPLVPLPPPAAQVTSHPAPAAPPVILPSNAAALGQTYPDNYSRHLDVYRQSNLYHNSRRAKDKKWSKDPMDDFARELLEYRRDRIPPPTRRSRSRSYHSPKSWSHSRSRSYSRSPSRSRSRSRSHTYSSRSRSRSFSRSRSRSRTPLRSFSRSRSHSRGSVHSGSRSPRRKYHSPHRFFRSRSRSPPKIYRGNLKPYHKRPDMPPTYYPESNYVPSYSANIPNPNQPVMESYGPERGYYDHYHLGYEGYPPQSENRRYNLAPPPHDGRFPPHLDRFMNQRKFRTRGLEKRQIVRKDGRLERVEGVSRYLPEKVKERALELPIYSSKEEKKGKEESRSHHHKPRESKKSNESTKKVKESKVKKEEGLEAAHTSVVKEGKTKKNSKGEKHIKEHKHRHKKVKEGEEPHKKKKKKLSSDDLSQVTGSESDKAKKKSKKKLVGKLKQISELTEGSEVLDNVKINSPILENKDLTPEAPKIAEDITVAQFEPVEPHSPLLRETEDRATPEPEDKNEEVEKGFLAEVVKEEAVSEGDPITGQEYNEIKDEASIKNESFSGDEPPIRSGEESEAEGAEDSVNEAVLKVHMPEISKWERDDSDEVESEDEPSSPASKKGEVDEGNKSSLSFDIIQKAENAILQKSSKLQIIVENVQAPRVKLVEHSENSPERTVSLIPESKHQVVPEKVEKPEKKEIVTKVPSNEVLKKKEDIRVVSHRRDLNRFDRDTIRKVKVPTEIRNVRIRNTYRPDIEVRMHSRDWDRDRPGSRNSTGSRHSSGSRNRSRSRNRVVRDKSREKPTRESHRNVRIRERPILGSSSKVTIKNETAARKLGSDSDGSASIRKKTVKEPPHDESNFEPNYDETSESDGNGSTSSNRERPKIIRRRVSIKNEPLPAKHRSGRSTHLDSNKRKASKEDSVHSRSSADQKRVERRKQTTEPVVPSRSQHRKASEDSESGEALSKKSSREGRLEVAKEIATKQPKDKPSESVSSSSTESESDTSETDDNPKKKQKTESLDHEQKHRQKRTKHKKHKKHKHKHKKRKSTHKERDEARVMSSVVRR